MTTRTIDIADAPKPPLVARGSIYREAALHGLSGADPLEAPLILVGRPMWLMLAACALMIVAALVGAFVARVPVKVAGRGILIDRSGLSEIVAGQSGRIERVLVSPGDHVVAGQVIATLAARELVRDIDDARARLAASRRRYARLAGLYGRQGDERVGADAQRLDALADARRALEERERYLIEKIASMDKLVARGFIQRDRVAEIQIALADVRERLSGLSQSRTRLRIDASEWNGRSEMALLDERRAIEEEQRSVRRADARWRNLRLIRAPAAGRIAEIKAGSGDMIAPGTALATVLPEGDGELVAIVYVPAADGQRIRPGMAAEIAPTMAEHSLYGHMRGRVAAVAPLASTFEGMRRLLRNGRLAQQLAAGGAPLEVRIVLERDPATPSGFAWSASRGPAAGIGTGAIVDGRVVVLRRRLIAWLLPGRGR